MKFTPAEKEYFAKVRAEDPAVDQLFKDLRQMMETFKGSSIKYLRVRESEWGEDFPPGEPAIFAPRPETIRNDKKTQQTARSAKERRRAMTRYK